MELASAFHTLVTADGLSSWNGVYALKQMGFRILIILSFYHMQHTQKSFTQVAEISLLIHILLHISKIGATTSSCVFQSILQYHKNNLKNINLDTLSIICNDKLISYVKHIQHSQTDL